MLEAHAAGETPPTLRVYGWQPRAVSLGRFQSVDTALNLDACRELGVDVVRRPTGGRAILHTTEEITFSIVVSAARLGTTGVMDSYRALAAPIVSALRLLGADARLVERRASAARQGSSRDPACFAVKARCDLIVGSSKLVGSAQVQRRGFLLQQNSLPLRLDFREWQDVLLRASLRPDAVGLSDAVCRDIGYAEGAEALRLGFAQEFTAELEPGSLIEAESTRARELLKAVLVQ
jgi:lipoate-protein ligase A